ALVGTNITGTAAGLTAGNVTTNANLTGEVTSIGNAATVPNATVIGKVLTGYASGAGAVSSTDNILQAIQKLNGNNSTNANLTGPITSIGNATAVASQTGTGSTFVMNASPTLVTPVLGVATATSINGSTIPTSKTLVVTTDKLNVLSSTTSTELAGVISDETGTGGFVLSTSPTLVTPSLGTPSALVGTNITGTAAGLTAGNVTTNANLTGDVTSSGNATTIGASKVTNTMLAGSIDLISKVTGILPLVNGGTGSSTQNFVDLTTDQTIAGSKTFNNDISVKGLVVGLGSAGVASNVGIGRSTLVSNTVGINNVGIGEQAGRSITGSNNVAIGFTTNRNTTEGSSNIAIGDGANYQGTSGSHNVSLGTGAYREGNSGSYNIALGNASLYDEATGSNNIALGRDSGRYNNGGQGNITLGYQSGNSIISGSYNVVIGYDADVSADNLINATALGNGAIVDATNTIQLGNTAVTNVKTSGTLTAGAVIYTKTDGTTGQVLTTNGAGVTSWGTPTASVREVADEFSATASQSSFTLAQTKSINSKVKMYINGVRISNSAYSVSGTTLTYTPASNGGYALVMGDRIQFDYFY
ncbi:beta strand repeat-containing protein, partial [Flavobacterium frigoris]